MLAEAALYLDDADFRRTSLVESLTNPKNTYSRPACRHWFPGLEAHGDAGFAVAPVSK